MTIKFGYCFAGRVRAKVAAWVSQCLRVSSSSPSGAMLTMPLIGNPVRGRREQADAAFALEGSHRDSPDSFGLSRF